MRLVGLEAKYAADRTEVMEFRSSDLTKNNPTVPSTAVYCFARKYGGPMRLYIGQSNQLIDRILGQRHLRKWSGWLIIFPVQNGSRKALLAMESALIYHLSLLLRGRVIWDNTRGLCRSPDAVFSSTAFNDVPLLWALYSRLPEPLVTTITQETTPTHVLGAPSAVTYGLAHTRGGKTWLLKGSRLSLHYSRSAQIDQCCWSHNRIRQGLQDGTIARQREAKMRPAGLIVTEPIAFRLREEATNLLFCGQEPSLGWTKVPIRTVPMPDYCTR